MRKRRNSFVNPSNKEDPYYDIFEDWQLIDASFTQQYGIRLRRESDMSWDEFCTLLSGLRHDTPLGNIISIRSETDKDIIKHFTPQQKKIRSDWQRRKAKKVVNMDQYNYDMKMFEKMFESLAKAGDIKGT